MPPSHILVLLSIVSALVLLSFILFYSFIYPKRKIPPFILFILIACLPLISILRPGTYESGDLSTHIMQEIYFYKVLFQGDLFPVWAGGMNATYGYPAFLFTYPLPYYFMAIFHFIGFSFINSAKILLALSYLFSGIFMYVWLKKEVNEKGAFVGALFYLFAPYHLIDLHFRADIGETLAFVFLPLSLLAARNYISTKKLQWFIVEIFSFSALILSHPAVSISGIPIVLLYIFILLSNSQYVAKVRVYFIHLISFILSIFVTAFYWVPLLYQLRFTHHSDFTKNLDFVKLHELFYSTWLYGLLFQGHKGELSFLVGYAHLFIICIAIFFLIRKKFKSYEKNFIVLSLIITVSFSFIMIEVAKPLWYTVPFIKNFQFTYRLLGPIMFVAAIIAAIVASNIKNNKFIIFICIFAVFSTVLNWGNRGNVPEITDKILMQQIPFTAVNGAGFSQAITRWSDPQDPFARSLPQKHMEIIKGEGNIEELSRTNIRHEYLIDAKTQLVVKENTLYFPGWNVLIDHKPQSITILKSSSPSGIMSFTVPQGKRRVDVVFKDTFIVCLGKIISISAVSLLTLFFFFNKYYQLVIKIKKRK